MLSIDEAIAKEKENAEKLRKIIETGYDGEISIEAIFCDDASAIKEAYERFENCAKEHEQRAECLEELKAIKEMDLSIPQHFTKEQSDWIKAYCIQRNKEFYNKAIDDFVKKINECNQGHWRPTRYEHGEVVSETMSYDIGTIRLIAKQLKVGGKNE